MTDFLGWCGTILYLLNHGYISHNQNWRKNIYFGGNGIAATCLIISSYFSNSWQAVVINGFWLIISLLLLFNVELKSLKVNRRFFHLILISIWLAIIFDYFNTQNFNLSLMGWTSAFVFSACYLLFSAEKMLPRNYLLWNAYAAIALLPQLWLDQNWPVFSLEIAWACISIYGAVRRFKTIHLIG